MKKYIICLMSAVWVISCAATELHISNEVDSTISNMDLEINNKAYYYIGYRLYKAKDTYRHVCPDEETQECKKAKEDLTRFFVQILQAAESHIHSYGRVAIGESKPFEDMYARSAVAMDKDQKRAFAEKVMAAPETLCERFLAEFEKDRAVTFRDIMERSMEEYVQAAKPVVVQ